MYLEHAPLSDDNGSSHVLNTAPHLAINVKHAPSFGDSVSSHILNTRPQYVIDMLPEIRPAHGEKHVVSPTELASTRGEILLAVRETRSVPEVRQSLYFDFVHETGFICLYPKHVFDDLD